MGLSIKFNKSPGKANKNYNRLHCPNGQTMMSNHTDMQDKYCGDCYDIHPVPSQYTKVAACGRHHKRGDAPFGRATSFVVAANGRHLCVFALNKVNLVAATTSLVLQVGNGRSEQV